MREKPTLRIPLGVLALLFGLALYVLAVVWGSQWIERLPVLAQALVYLVLGVAWLGAVEVPINNAYLGGMLHHLLEDSQARSRVVVLLTGGLAGAGPIWWGATRLTGVTESRLRANACTQHSRRPRILQ